MMMMKNSKLFYLRMKVSQMLWRPGKRSTNPGPAEPVGPVGPWPNQNFDKDSSRMRIQSDCMSINLHALSLVTTHST